MFGCVWVRTTDREMSWEGGGGLRRLVSSDKEKTEEGGERRSVSYLWRHGK